MGKQLSALPPEHGDTVQAALRAVYNWNYGSELDELRTLYDKGLKLQWIAARDLPWERAIDKDAFSSSFSLGSLPIQETTLWQSWSPERRWEVARRGSAFMLSNFLHGEQGALMVASQLVNAVPHMDGKFYAATQTLDEARHVEVFARYIEKLDHVYPIAPALKTLLDQVLEAESWMMKCVGMQIVVERLALYTFRDMRNTTAEPLLKELLTYVSRDEAWHTAYGIKYLGAVTPTLGESERAELEDFAFESARLLLDSRRGLTMNQALLELLQGAGVDPSELMSGFQMDRDKIRDAVARKGGRLGPISGFVMPTLKSIGLLSDRLRGHFRDMFDHMGVSLPGASAASKGANPADSLVELPDDVEEWVMAGA
jgi:hypothetical protein